MDNQNTPFTPAPSPNLNQVPNPEAKKPKSKTGLFVLLIIIFAALSAGLVYFWQMNQNNNTTTKLNAANTKISELEAQIASQPKKTTQPTTSPTVTKTTLDLIPGNADTSRNDGVVTVDAIFKYSLEPTAVWVEYGTDPNKLDKETTKVTQGLGLGDPGATYATGFSVNIKQSDLKSGTVYYYRTAATVKGQTQTSGIASFTTVK